MEIRLMKIQDYEEVFDIWKRTPGMGLNTIDDSRDGIKKYLDRNPSTCFVAAEDNRIIGVILSGHDGRRAFIHHLAVRSENRNQGIGRRLVDSAMKALDKEGISKVALVVMRTNEIGNAFWESLGFESRPDLVYRNKMVTAREVKRIETI